MKTLTTPEALQYIADHTGRDKPPHKQQLNRWMRYKDADGNPWIRPTTIGGMNGKPHTFTIMTLDDLCYKINSKQRPDSM